VRAFFEESGRRDLIPPCQAQRAVQWKSRFSRSGPDFSVEPSLWSWDSGRGDWRATWKNL